MTGSDLQRTDPSHEAAEISAQDTLSQLQAAVAAAAHDMKQSVAVIRIVDAILRSAWADLDQAEHDELVAHADRQGVHLDHLADRLMEVASLDPDALGARVEPLELSGYLLARLSDLMLEPPEVRLSCPKGVRALADPDHMWQIVHGLITQTSGSGAAPIDVVVIEEDGWVVFRFREHRPSDFRDIPSFWFARELARANGGDVWHEWDGDGSVIALRLPVAPLAISR